MKLQVTTTCSSIIKKGQVSVKFCRVFSIFIRLEWNAAKMERPADVKRHEWCERGCYKSLSPVTQVRSGPGVMYHAEDWDASSLSSPTLLYKKEIRRRVLLDP